MTDYITVIEALAIHEDQIHRYGGAAGAKVLGFERGGDIRHVPVQTTLRDQCACRQCGGEEAEWQTKELVLHDECDCADHTHENDDRDNAQRCTPARLEIAAIKATVERADQAADPGYRMADRGHEPLWITEAEFDQHGDEC